MVNIHLVCGGQQTVLWRQHNPTLLSSKVGSPIDFSSRVGGSIVLQVNRSQTNRLSPRIGMLIRQKGCTEISLPR